MRSVLFLALGAMATSGSFRPDAASPQRQTSGPGSPAGQLRASEPIVRGAETQPPALTSCTAQCGRMRRRAASRQGSLPPQYFAASQPPSRRTRPAALRTRLVMRPPHSAHWAMQPKQIRVSWRSPGRSRRSCSAKPGTANWPDSPSTEARPRPMQRAIRPYGCLSCALRPSRLPLREIAPQPYA